MPDQLVTSPEGGKKYDGNKTRYDLLPREVLAGVARVMTYGADKYDAYNWQNVELPRYLSALDRHFDALMRGETHDEDTGEHHGLHFACNALFIAWLVMRKPEQLTAYRAAQAGVE